MLKNKKLLLFILMLFVAVFISASSKAKASSIYDQLYDEIQITTSADVEQEKDEFVREVDGRRRQHIRDKVSMKKLLVGRPYKIEGILYVKETKKPLLIKGKEVTSTLDFIAKDSNENKYTNYYFNGFDMEGVHLVVYEKLYDMEFGTKTLVASEENIDNENQTIYIRNHGRIKTKIDKGFLHGIYENIKTGDSILMVIVCILLMIISSCYLIKSRKDRKNEKKN